VIAGIAAFTCASSFFVVGGSDKATATGLDTVSALSLNVTVASDGTPTWSQAPSTSGAGDKTTNGYDAGRKTVLYASTTPSHTVQTSI